MNFIELTDRNGDKFLMNLDRVEQISEMYLCNSPEIHADLYLVNDGKDIHIYVQETYEQIKEKLNVR